MKLLLIGLLSLLGATSLALIVRQDTGYVLIDVAGWTVETAFSLFVLFILALFLVSYLTTRFLARLWQVPARTRQWRGQRRLRNARRGLSSGLLELAAGNWATAQKQLARSARYSETPLLHYLGAARAAQQQTQHQQRDEFLKQAAETAPQLYRAGHLAVGITQAELQLQQSQLELALATLNQLRELAPNHVHVLELLARLHLRLQDWEALQTLLPVLRKYKVREKAQLDALEDQTLLALLNAQADVDTADLEQFWDTTPKRFREQPDTLRLYLKLVSDRPGANHDAAAEAIRGSLKRHWDPDLLAIYARLQESDKNRQFRRAEAWLHEHPTDSALLLTLGILARRNALWGKARSYLESSLALSANSLVLQELGDVLLEMGEPETAARRYREGLEIATGRPSDQAGFGFENRSLAHPNPQQGSDGDDDDQPLSPESHLIEAHS